MAITPASSQEHELGPLKRPESLFNEIRLNTNTTEFFPRDTVHLGYPIWELLVRCCAQLWYGLLFLNNVLSTLPS